MYLNRLSQLLPLTKLFLNAIVNFLIIIFIKMKNTTNTLNKLTKLLAIAIFSVSLNAFSVAISLIIIAGLCGRLSKG
jgi:fluoride ion exporter CrcB/FEX